MHVFQLMHSMHAFPAGPACGVIIHTYVILIRCKVGTTKELLVAPCVEPCYLTEREFMYLAWYIQYIYIIYIYKRNTLCHPYIVSATALSDIYYIIT